MQSSRNGVIVDYGVANPLLGNVTKRWNLINILPLICLPFTSAFAIGDWLPLTMASGLLTFIIYISSPTRRFNIRLELIDFMLVMAIISGLIGLLYAPGYGNRTLNHTLAIISCSFLYYYFYRDNILRSMSLLRVSELLTKLGLVAGLFIIAEFISANIFHLRFSEVIPYKEIESGEEYVFDSLMLGQWLRPRGFAIEAGHMASFFEVTVPISVIWLRTKNALIKIIYLIPTLCGFFLLSSAAGITALSLATVIVLIKSRIHLGIKAVLVVLVLIAGIWTSKSGLFEKYIEPLVATKALGFFGLKVTDDRSALDRSARAMTALNVVSDYPMGIGWGSAAHLSKEEGGLNGVDIPFGFISLYAEFLVAGGWFGLLFLLIFIVSRILQLWILKSLEAACILCAMLSVSIHFGTMSNYWFPVFWLPFALVPFTDTDLRGRMLTKNMRFLKKQKNNTRSFSGS